jgi:O-antigen biosynthesis protein
VERVLFAPRELPSLSPDVSQDPGDYTTWVRLREDERRRRSVRVSGPALALVLVVADAPKAALGRTLESLNGQTSRHWTLVAVVAESRLSEVRALIRAAGRRMRHRARVIALPDGTAAGDQLWTGIRTNQGAPFGLLLGGDAWAPDAVATLRAALTTMGVVYADEDCVTAEGTHAEPHLKPDYSPDFLLSSPYTGRPIAVGAGLSSTIPRGVASDAPAAEHELALRACELAESVLHIPEVLCHRWGDAGHDFTPADTRHVDAALRRSHAGASVVSGAVPGTFRVQWPKATDVMISILIPFRDEPVLLRTCVDSVTATTEGQETELVLIDNGSTDPETETLLERLARRKDVRVVHDDRPFNWAQLNNVGARAARGEILLFLNNDIEAHQHGWLSALGAHALREDIGAVGARLLYPNGRLQHCGLVVGLTGAAGHPLAGLPPDSPGYLNMATVTRECSAVTGACLATRREVFEHLGGFDETLGVDLNDVDYCLRAASAGYRTVFEPRAELIHHESPSRGTAGGVGDIVNFVDRWKDYIHAGDPYFNAHLTRIDPSCALARPEEEEMWNQWYSTLAT